MFINCQNKWKNG